MDVVQRTMQLIEEKGINQKTLADAIGVSTGNITDWKKGRSKPSYSAIVKMARYFDVSADYLLGNADLRPNREKSSIEDIRIELRGILNRLPDKKIPLDKEEKLIQAILDLMDLAAEPTKQ